MSVKCGKGHDHETVAEVKTCYQVKTEDPKATDKQVIFLGQLLARKNCFLSDGRQLTELTRAEASHFIDEMLAYSKDNSGFLPKGITLSVSNGTRSTEHNPLPDVPAGHYAVPSLTGNNDLDFFRVDKGEGRWAGRTFVNRVIGGRPSVAVRGTTARQALEAIKAAGPEEAMKKYGQEIGRCYRCNRHLTDETSRALGIGPDCRSK